MRTIAVVIGLGFLGGCTDVPTDTGAMGSSTQLGNTTESDSGLSKMRDYPDPNTWEHANDRQRKRALRSFEHLKKHNAPVYLGPLFVDDDEEVSIQTAEEVAKRTLVLWAVVLRAEGMSKDNSLEFLVLFDLRASVSPEEMRFLEDDNPNPDESQQLVWRLESIWVLLWALGYIEVLDWPSGMCDVERLAEILEPNELSQDFITKAKLRSKAEILDAQDLIMRTNWAIRDAYLQGGMIPDNLDWSKESDLVSLATSPAVGVVEQRHYTLNWLVNFLDPESWDHVDTPT